MAQDPNDPRPQVQINTVGGSKHQAPRNAYTNPPATFVNLQGQVGTTPALPLGNDLKNAETPVYDVPGIDHTPDNPPSNVPNAPNIWVEGRDYYKNNGMIGQPFFRNSVPYPEE
jgi:hypothetical protein